MIKKIQKYSHHEEYFNAFTHAPGIVLGLVLTIVLLGKNFEALSALSLVSIVVYGITFSGVFAASAAYHFSSRKEKKNVCFYKRLDHASIFTFIGGCYTVLVMNAMVASWRYYFLGLIWLIVLIGVVYKFKSKYKGEAISLTLYLSFSLLCFLAKKDLLDVVPAHSFSWLLLGGAFYIAGIFFYIKDKIPFMHMIWHLFVLAGALAHFVAIYETI